MNKIWFHSKIPIFPWPFFKIPRLFWQNLHSLLLPHTATNSKSFLWQIANRWKICTNHIHVPNISQFFPFPSPVINRKVRILRNKRWRVKGFVVGIYLLLLCHPLPCILYFWWPTLHHNQTVAPYYLQVSVNSIIIK